MIKYENQCVGCPPEMGCLGSTCPYIKVPVYICDECGDECEELHEYEDMELCSDCYEEATEADEESEDE